MLLENIMAKTGLVLEGGAMRGLFSSGVMDVMMEEGICFDGMIGVSAGAVFGCNYKSGQIGRAIRYNTQYCRDPRYCSVRSLIRTGDLYGKDFCYNVLPNELDPFDAEAFYSSPAEFYMVCTDVNTGKPVYHKSEKPISREFEWMRASASLPLVSRVVEVDGLHLLDGGISDAIPLKYFESIGYTRNVVILTQPKDYVKKPNRMVPLMKLVLGKYPALIKAVQTRHEMYNETLKFVWERARAGSALVICPDASLPIKRIEHDPDKLRHVYELGREMGKRRLDEVARFLSK